MINLTGKVIQGQKYGRILGFPTANIDRRDFIRQKLKLRLGVWAGKVRFQVQGSRFKVYTAGIVIGPLDNKRLPKIEAHLIGFRGNLYGKKISISLQKYIRPFRKFSSELKLKNQIKIDLNKIKQITL